MRYRKHAMMGRGGEVRVPKSESKELTKIFQILENIRFTELSDHSLRSIREAMQRIKELGIQVSEGYHRNPYTPLRIVGTISDDVHTVAYRHAKDGKLYKHDFGEGNAKLYAIERHGKRDLLISGGNLPLWDDF